MLTPDIPDLPYIRVHVAASACMLRSEHDLTLSRLRLPCPRPRLGGQFEHIGAIALDLPPVLEVVRLLTMTPFRSWSWPTPFASDPTCSLYRLCLIWCPDTVNRRESGARSPRLSEFVRL